ncbi:MAG: transaldolase, partial [Bacillota bacterium]|nr:transaldolase [Bacillota bacterium]
MSGNLLEMTKKYPQTHYWNDSCSLPELRYAIERGAVGATTNPVIVKQVLERELEHYAGDIRRLLQEHPQESEDEISWRI